MTQRPRNNGELIELLQKFTEDYPDYKDDAEQIVRFLQDNAGDRHVFEAAVSSYNNLTNLVGGKGTRAKPTIRDDDEPTTGPNHDDYGPESDAGPTEMRSRYRGEGQVYL